MSFGYMYYYACFSMSASVVLASIGAHAIKEPEKKELINKAVFWNVVNNFGIMIGNFSP